MTGNEKLLIAQMAKLVKAMESIAESLKYMRSVIEKQEADNA